MNPLIELQGLNVLDVTGNKHWFPSEQLLQLNNLTTVEGVRLSQYCQDCSLTRLHSVVSIPECGKSAAFAELGSWLFHDQIKYGKALDLITLGFWPSCLCGEVCFTEQFHLPYISSTNDIAIKGYFCLYAAGSVALLVNIAVVLFVVFNKSLRNDLAVCLVMNTALCDALVGLAVILHATFTYGPSYMKYLHDTLRGQSYDYFDRVLQRQNITGPLLTGAVAAQAFGSWIAMLDKFFKIVFAMKPGLRVRKKNALFFVMGSWSIAITYALLPVFRVGSMAYSVVTSYTPLPADDEDGVGGSLEWRPLSAATVSQFALVVIQLTGFALYLPIFAVARKSGASMGIRREASIARKIALLVCTNIVFFIVPIILAVFKIQITEKTYPAQDRELYEIQWAVFTVMVLPILCLSMNSVLNPFLYALRHPKIKQEIKTFLSRCGNTFRRCSDVVGLSHSSLRSTAVQPDNDLQTQDTRL